MRIQSLVLPLLFLALLAAGLVFVFPAYMEYRRTRDQVSQLKSKVRQQELQISELRDDLEALRSDYRAVERVAREKFGLCKDGEKIYRFEAEPVLLAPAGAGDTGTDEP
jgi:cell division protein FtsB